MRHSMSKRWKLAGYFTLFISLPLLLFLASALILPHQPLSEGQNLRDEFQTDGQWALVCLSLYFILSLTADILLWKMKWLSLMGLQNIALILIPLTCARCRSQRGQGIITVLFGFLLLWSAVLSSPPSYWAESWQRLDHVSIVRFTRGQGLIQTNI